MIYKKVSCAIKNRKSLVFNLVFLIFGISIGMLLSFCTEISIMPNRNFLALSDEFRRFNKVFSIIKSNYVEIIEDKTLINNAISGMLSGLDSYSSYLDEDACKEMQILTEGEFFGLGIEIASEDDGFIKVTSLIENTPAEKSGIQAGDIITNIDHFSTKEMPLSRAAKLMRGLPDSKVELTILHPNHWAPVVLEITRKLIKIHSVRSKMLENDLFYIRIIQFQEKTGEDLFKQILSLDKNNFPKGLILDLRNDPGGLLSSAVAVSGIFLHSNVLIVSMHGRTVEDNQSYLSSSVEYNPSSVLGYSTTLPSWVKTVPMIVLINSGSASASEIVAGALQDHNRAKILGNRSFGKGSVQTILPLNESSALKITTAYYFMPSGRSIQSCGVEPDYFVTDTEEGNVFFAQRERDLFIKNKGNNDNNRTLETEVNSNRMIEFGEPDDFQLKKAISILNYFSFE